MALFPKRQTKKYFPGLGDEHVVTLDGLGYCAIDATLTVDSVITNANLVGLPPNSTGVPSNVITHSLGTVPTAVIPLPIGPTSGARQVPIDVQLVTMDNSAVYLRAFTSTGTQAGAAFKFLVIR